MALPNSSVQSGLAQAGGGSRGKKELAYKAYVVAQEQGIIVEAWLPETVGLDVNAQYEAPYAQGIGQLNEKVGELARFLGVSLTTQSLTAQIWQGSGEFIFTLPFVFQAEDSAANDVMLNIKRLLSLTMPDGNDGGLLTAPGPHLDLKKLASNTGAELVSRAMSLKEITFSGGADMRKEMLTRKGMLQSASNVTLGGVLGGAADAAAVALNKEIGALSQLIKSSVVNNISLYIGQFIYLPSVVITDVSPTFDVVLAEDKNPIRATVNVVFKSFFVPTKQDMEDMFPAVAGLPIQNGSGSSGAGMP